MLPLETIAAFLLAAILLALAPGPDNIFVLTLSILRGSWAGFLVVLGLCSGLLVHTAIVTMGVAVIFQTSILAFSILKFIGAAYLVYLAWLSFRAGPEKLQSKENTKLNGWKLYGRGIIMNVTNPKVSIFFLAFLPQFAKPEYGSMSLQLITLGGLFIISALVVFTTIAFTAGKLGTWLNRSERIQTRLNKIAGVVFLALAAKLVTTSQH